jgi:hypothetical protein
MKTLFSSLLHLVRLILSKTLHKNAVHELDEIETDSSNTSINTTNETAVDIEKMQLISPVPAELLSTQREIVPITVPRLPVLTIGADGWVIGDKVVRVPTERLHAWRTKSGEALGVMWHWTATAHGTALAMAKRIMKGPGTSVHGWVEYDGTFYQSAPFTRSVGHGGGKTALRMSEKNGKCVIDPTAHLDANSFLQGIEIVCVGEVRLVMKKSDGSYGPATAHVPSAVYMGWPFGKWKKDEDNGKLFVAKGPIVDQNEVDQAVDEEGVRRYYQDYTIAQVNTIERLCRAMRDKYKWTDDQLSWGHIDSDPGRKTDPGPLFRKKWLPMILEKMKKDPQG